MLAVLAVVFPVFAIILLGFLAAQRRLLPEGTGKGLADFVFSVAMPALLFHTMATVKATGVPPAGLIAGYFGANFLTWVLASLATTRLLGRPVADAPAISMAACFGNTVMLGLPLGTAFFGTGATAAIAVIVALHSPALWMAATLQQEWIERRGGGNAEGQQKLSRVAFDLLTNPIVFSVLTGSLWRLTGIGLPGPASTLLELLGQAAVPGALFALGFGLTRFEVRSDWQALSTIVVLKLLLMPLAGWILATRLLGLPPIGIDAVTLLAACPTGANAFLFASRNERSVGPVAGAIAVGTTLAAPTISLTLLLLSSA